VESTINGVPTQYSTTTLPNQQFDNIFSSGPPPSSFEDMTQFIICTSFLFLYNNNTFVIFLVQVPAMIIQE
jgi:hypothetical protein